jgi:two-component system response regulator DctR
MTPTVHIVDDDADFRDGLAWLLDSRGLPVRAWSGGDAFLQAMRQPQGDGWPCCVVLLDIRMEPLSGLATFEQLKALGWPWPVLFLTGHGDVGMAVAAVKNGAWDFLEKPFQNNLLVDRVAEAQRAALALQADAGERLRFQKAVAALSAREREVLAELLQGHYNKNIADHLGITQRTVEFHRANIFEKLQVQSAVELAHRVGLYGLLPQTAPTNPGLGTPPALP